jgi:hypothetical protein
MEASIDRARREVQRAFDEALSWAESSQERSLWEFERGLWTLMLALGRALVELFLVRCVARPRPVEYKQHGVPYVLDVDEPRTSELGTRFGKVQFQRPVGRIPWSQDCAADLPIDRELGLCSGFSLGVVMAITRLCAQLAFRQARETFREAYEWMPSPRAVLRMVDGVGAQARPFLEQGAAPEGDGEVLLIQADGGGAPMIGTVEFSRRRLRRAVAGAQRRHRRRPSQRQQARARSSNGTRRHQRRDKRRARPRKRRTKGQKSKNSKVAVVGVLYTLRRTPAGLEGPVNKRIYATFHSHEELFQWLRREADKRGYGNKPSLFIGDGCEHLWRLQQRYFPDADACLDWYHVVEKLWSAGECLYPEGSNQLAAWVAQQKKSLRRGCIQQLLDTLAQTQRSIPKTGPGNKGKRKRLLEIFNHLDKHKHRMRYHALRRKDLDIGSGVVEGAVRNLVRMRLDGPGMRWGRPRSELVLHLRCILLNGQWDEFADYLASRSGLKLPAKPLPAQPHDAKSQDLRKAA